MLTDVPSSFPDCIQFCKSHHWMDDAVGTIAVADIKAQDTSCEFIGTEHLLLALLAYTSHATILLQFHNPRTISGIVKQIENLSRATPSVPTSKQRTNFAIAFARRQIRRFLSVPASVPNPDPVTVRELTPRTRKAVETATLLASTDLNWSDGNVRTEHLLFALLSDSESAAYHLLINFDATYTKILSIARGVAKSELNN
ncbi:Clp protease N-terminal domain-containing protein [Novipirellula sp. SH528]|uniref:Clp protease N-terminal domain-containing protein n=1 Tax=Novipirellula sp. SH528 TaxID=3454466 RepID=UPI003F9F32BF